MKSSCPAASCKRCEDSIFVLSSPRLRWLLNGRGLESQNENFIRRYNLVSCSVHFYEENSRIHADLNEFMAKTCSMS